MENNNFFFMLLLSLGCLSLDMQGCLSGFNPFHRVPVLLDSQEVSPRTACQIQELCMFAQQQDLLPANINAEAILLTKNSGKVRVIYGNIDGFGRMPFSDAKITEFYIGHVDTN